LLRQAVELVELLDDEVLRATSDLLPGGTVGKHLRHVLDFHEALERGLAAGRVDYTGRARDVEVERDGRVVAARARLAIEWLVRLGPEDCSRPLLVLAEDGDGSWCRSTLSRELRFLESHAVHHFALVAALLRLHGIDPPEHFGVAPSTIAYWRSRATSTA
jgi:uncharacterized damage-inducible protein DinB